MHTGFVLLISSFKPCTQKNWDRSGNELENPRQKEKHTLRAEIGERERQEEKAMFCWETRKPRKTRVVVASSFAY